MIGDIARLMMGVEGGILGLNYSGMHDSAVALVSEAGEVLYACALERITRIKQEGRPPYELLEGLPWERISAVAVSTEWELVLPQDPASAIHPARLPAPRGGGLIHGPEFQAFLDTLPAPKQYVCHHLSHAASAFWPSGFDDALCLVYDGGMSNGAWFGGLYRADKTHGIEALDRFSASHYAKITTLYTSVTALLGFTPNKHEGKITGLAAYGKPTDRCREVLWQLFTEDYFALEEMTEWFFAYSRDIPPMLLVDDAKRQRLKERFAGIGREEMAATVQAMTEEHILKILDNAAKQGWTSERICLSGGLFANVKINQRVKEWGFKEIYISPPMTDDGTALGAALHMASKTPGFKPELQKHVYYGPSYTSADVAEAIDRWQLNHEKLAAPAERIAEVLAQGAVVALFQGGMEFGPRALGNRSIVSQATDAGINKSLNDRLLRTEFMPFAPITRMEDMAECYVGLAGAEHAAQFMTITCACTNTMRERCPAAVHVDGTARPQLVTQQQPLLHDVLRQYRAKTGRPALINTSFNIHEEPIVCTPDDAIKGFLEAGLDYLYLEGGYWVAFAGNREQALALLQRERGEPSRKEGDVGHVLTELFGRINAADAREVEKERELGKLKEKEAVIAELKAASDAAQAQLAEKGVVIAELKAASDAAQAQLAEKGVVIAELKAASDAMRVRLAEKDAAIKALSEASSALSFGGSLQVNQAMAKSLEEKEAVIQGLSKALDAYRMAYSLRFRPLKYCKEEFGRLKGVLWAMLRPRLGNLNQYPPRPMQVPARYFKPIYLSATPKVSIVTPSYNQAEFIGRTIDSVLQQEYPNLEYFVQDGGSLDGTVDVLKSYEGRIQGWESRPDGGQSQAINLSFAKTNGEIMAWLNSDDILLPGAIAFVVDYFNRHPEVDVIYGNRILIDEQDREIGRWVLPAHDDEVLSWADFVPQETLFWRRSIWEKAGGQIDESFRFAMDWDLLLRFRAAGASMIRLPRLMAAFRIHEAQKTSSVINDVGMREMDKLRFREIGRVPAHDEVRRALIPYLIRHVISDFGMRLHMKLNIKKALYD